MFYLYLINFMLTHLSFITALKHICDTFLSQNFVWILLYQIIKILVSSGLLGHSL